MLWTVPVVIFDRILFYLFSLLQYSWFLLWPSWKWITAILLLLFRDVPFLPSLGRRTLWKFGWEKLFTRFFFLKAICLEKNDQKKPWKARELQKHCWKWFRRPWTVFCVVLANFCQLIEWVSNSLDLSFFVFLVLLMHIKDVSNWQWATILLLFRYQNLSV